MNFGAVIKSVLRAVEQNPWIGSRHRQVNSGPVLVHLAGSAARDPRGSSPRKSVAKAVLKHADRERVIDDCV